MAIPGLLKKPEITPNMLINAFCEVAEISYSMLKEKTRIRSVSTPRQTLMRLLYINFPRLTTTDIAALVNLENHATVIHAIKNTSNLLETNSNYRTYFMGILDGINKIVGATIEYKLKNRKL